MASDPQLGTYPNQPDPHTFGIEGPVRKRSMWQTCLIGCLGVLAVMLVLAVIAGFWISRHGREWFAGVGAQVINQGIDSSDLPPQEKVEVKVEVDRVAKGIAEGQISNEQAMAIFEKLGKSPLMPLFVVMAVERKYFGQSKLSEDEKAEGRRSLQRFARGVFDDKIDKKGIDAVMSHVADRKQNDQWQLRSTVSDDELRAALSEAKVQADGAGIPAEPENVDPSDEIKRIIDESLRVDVEAPQN
jgi:hypothetical protein